MAVELDKQEAALYLGMMQIHEALGQKIDRKADLGEEELVKLEAARTAAFNLQRTLHNLTEKVEPKEEPKEELKCDSCGCLDSKRDVEVSTWAEKGEQPRMLCFLCEQEAEHSFYDAEATEVINASSI